MEIEIIKDEIDPLKNLLNYLNTNIYPKMNKKDVESIMSEGGLSGGLVQEIMKYERIMTNKAVLQQTEDLKKQLANKQEIIEELRDGREERKVYTESKYKGD